jgi:hypothetical protein
MLYASSMQQFKRALDVNVSVYADILEEKTNYLDRRVARTPVDKDGLGTT